MPSKRKKNKRRMRRVQAQRRLLEEQYAASPPVKASPALAVGAPGTVSKKTAKKPKPVPSKAPEIVAKVPEVVSIVPEAVPIVEVAKVIPKVEPPKEEPVPVPAPIKFEVPAEPEPEKPPVKVEVPAEPEPEVVVLQQIPVEVEIPEVPAPVITEEPITIEEPVITEEPVTIEEPVITEEPVTIVEPEILEEPIVEALPVETATVEVAVVQEEEEIETEPEIEVLAAEVPVAAPAEIQVVEETAVITEIEQDAPIPNGGLSLEPDALPLPPLTAAPEPVTQIEEAPLDTADVMVDDFVVTDTSAEVIEPTTIELLPVFEKPTVAVCEIFGLGPAKTVPEPELDTSTEEVLTDDAADSLETCPMEEASLTNTSVNMFVETEWIKQTPEVSSLEI